MNLLLKFHLMQVVLSGELPTTIFALEGHLTLTKRCYQTKLLMYMASTIRALINHLFHSISGNWAWAEDKNIWITASYIPGKENYHAKKKNWTGMNASPKHFYKYYFQVWISTRGRLIYIKTQCPNTLVGLIPS